MLSYFGRKKIHNTLFQYKAFLKKPLKFLSIKSNPTYAIYLACSLSIRLSNFSVFCLIPKIFQFLGNTRHPPLCIHFTGERPRTEPLHGNIPAQTHSRASRIDSSRFLLPGREPVTPGTYVEPVTPGMGRELVTPGTYVERCPNVHTQFFFPPR